MQPACPVKRKMVTASEKLTVQYWNRLLLQAESEGLWEAASECKKHLAIVKRKIAAMNQGIFRMNEDVELISVATEIRNSLPDGDPGVTEFDELRAEYYRAQVVGRGKQGIVELIRGWLSVHRHLVSMENAA